MAKKQSKKRMTSKAATRTQLDLSLKLHVIRLFDSKSEQAILAARPLSKFTLNASCEAAEPTNQGEAYILSYRVGSEILWASNPEDSGEGSRVTAACRYEVQFMVDRQPSTKEVEEVANVAMNCCWPYMRAFISVLLKEMGQPPIILPLLKIDPKHGVQFLTPTSGGVSRPKSE